MTPERNRVLEQRGLALRWESCAKEQQHGNHDKVCVIVAQDGSEVAKGRGETWEAALLEVWPNVQRASSPMSRAEMEEKLSTLKAAVAAADEAGDANKVAKTASAKGGAA